jgi:DNA-binding NarL/FixJ family response regulator
MQDDQPIVVLILYSHPLFGDGLLELLGREPGLEVSAVPMDDADAVQLALDASPQVVLAECRAASGAVAILEQVPDALIIEVGLGPGPMFAYRRDEIAAMPESVVAAIRQASTRPRARRRRSGDPAPAAASRG